MSAVKHTANVFLPGCLGPVRREVVLEEDHESEVEKWRKGSELRDDQNRDLHAFVGQLTTERDALAAECEVLRNRPAQTLAENLIDQLVESGAENYTESVFDVEVDGGEKLTCSVILRYRDKPGPHELRRQAEAELARLRGDAERWRKAREILTVEAIESAQSEYLNFGLPPCETESVRADAAIDDAMAKEPRDE